MATAGVFHMLCTILCFGVSVDLVHVGGHQIKFLGAKVRNAAALG